MPSFQLLGMVFGHGRFLDGGVILTSDLIEVRGYAAGGIRVGTLDTIYRLGWPWVGELPVEHCMLACDIVDDDWPSGCGSGVKRRRRTRADRGVPLRP